LFALALAADSYTDDSVKVILPDGFLSFGANPEGKDYLGR